MVRQLSSGGAQDTMARMLETGGGPSATPQLLTAAEVADLLVEARLEDVAIIDLSPFEPRTADALVVASGRSQQHAHAGEVKG